MRSIAHISDLHFGRVNLQAVSALQCKLRELAPDIVVVSGDLTQRARKWQFRAAREFLDSLPAPQIIVPGNHDVPLENLIDRFFRPLASYQKFITADLNPTYCDSEIAVFGLNTARGTRRSAGSISERQIEDARRFFGGVDRCRTKIVVTHHPFDFTGDRAGSYIVRRAREIIVGLAEYEADLYLAGHGHVSLARHTAHRYQVEHHSALIVQAGTCLSTRTRSEPNSFNFLYVDRPTIVVEQLHYYAGAFTTVRSETFTHTSSGWREAV